MTKQQTKQKRRTRDARHRLVRERNRRVDNGNGQQHDDVAHGAAARHQAPLGLGEEQLQDSNKPASPVNARVQIIAFGEPDAVEPKPAAPAAAAKKGAAPAKKKR